MSHTRGDNRVVPSPYNQIEVTLVLEKVPMRTTMRRLASLTNDGQFGGHFSLRSAAPFNPLSSGAPFGISFGGLEGCLAQQLMHMVAQFFGGRGVRTLDDGDGGIPLVLCRYDDRCMLVARWLCVLFLCFCKRELCLTKITKLVVCVSLCFFVVLAV